MDFNLSHKVALVTAASQGLGKASALELAREGCELIICSRNEDKIKDSAKDIEAKTQSKVTSLVVDLGNSKEIDYLFEEIKKNYDGIDILVNNAGGPPLFFCPGTMASDVAGPRGGEVPNALGGLDPP